MSQKIRTNFGAINGRRVMTFKVSHDGLVIPKKWDTIDAPLLDELHDRGELITAHESFRRWKIARKAWHTRRWRHQMQFQFQTPQP